MPEVCVVSLSSSPARVTGIYIVSGHPVFVFLEDGVERRIETGPGDYVFVPPYVPHREENPGEEPAG